MEREQLKGKQTPGRWVVITSWRDYTVTAEGRDDHAIIWQDGAYDTPTMTEADATLMAEAGTVANETGMWPLDLVERIKELVEALQQVCNVDEFNRDHLHDSPKSALSNYAQVAMDARAILNKRPA